MRHQHSMSGPQVATYSWRLCNSSWGPHIEYLVLNRDGYVLCLEPGDLLAPVRKDRHGKSRHRHRLSVLIRVMREPPLSLGILGKTALKLALDATSPHRRYRPSDINAISNGFTTLLYEVSISGMAVARSHAARWR